jgi:hypothetical protein
MEEMAPLQVPSLAAFWKEHLAALAAVQSNEN